MKTLPAAAHHETDYLVYHDDFWPFHTPTYAAAMLYISEMERVHKTKPGEFVIAHPIHPRGRE